MHEEGGYPRPELVYALRAATELAACVTYEGLARGNAVRGGVAGARAMRAVLMDLDMDGTVVIGEGEPGETPVLYNGERVGRPDAAFKADIALDPLEGTAYIAEGMTNALAVIAVSPRGTMMSPWPAFYMEKFAAPPKARGKVDPALPVAGRIEALAEALEKPVQRLTIFVLEKPRHRGLVAEIRAAGARVALYPAGDVAGALLAAIPNSGIDALMGTGGSPEAIMSACAVRLLGGTFCGRFNPQLQTEAAAVRNAGLDTTRWYRAGEMITSERSFFCASGITSGRLLAGVQRDETTYQVQTMVIGGAAQERQIVMSFPPVARVAARTATLDAA